MSSADPSRRADPVCLVILDGWGETSASRGNAIASAGLTELPALSSKGGKSLLEASGAAVGIPDGIMGNSEVGHLTLGAGRILEQDLVRINRVCAAGSWDDVEEWPKLLAAVRAGSSRLHWLGLASSAGVHSDLAHLKAMMRAAALGGVREQYIHAFTDGRDTPPHSGRGFLAELNDFVDAMSAEFPEARFCVASLCGRYHAMDRDSRWDRTERAHRMLVLGEAPLVSDGLEAIEASYAAGITDEFLEPVRLVAAGRVRDGDSVVHFNFRADRARQLTAAFTEESFDAFHAERPRLATYTCMTQYSSGFPLPVLFRRDLPDQLLGESFSEAGWPQLRLAETEKYAHVTYFLNGGNEAVLPGEERKLVASPRVATYDETPEMSARELTTHACSFVAQGGSRLLVLNYANADMIGHTGSLTAAVEACKVVDECLGRLLDAVKSSQGVLLVTADHGNAECMVEADGSAMTRHTTNPVPFVIHDSRARDCGRRLRPAGGLRDVAPTVLQVAGLPVPSRMSGRSLLET